MNVRGRQVVFIVTYTQHLSNQVARRGPQFNPNASTYCSGGSTSLKPIYTILAEEIHGLIQENPGSCGTYKERNEQDSSLILCLTQIITVCFPVCATCFFFLPQDMLKATRYLI